MSEVLPRIRELVAKGNYAFSDHGYAEAEKDDILPLELVNGLKHAVVVEDYPDAHRGPTVLVFCRDENERPLHAVWGVHHANPNKAILITAYRPDSRLWTQDYLRRQK